MTKPTRSANEASTRRNNNDRFSFRSLHIRTEHQLDRGGNERGGPHLVVLDHRPRTFLDPKVNTIHIDGVKTPPIRRRMIPDPRLCRIMRPHVLGIFKRDPGVQQRNIERPELNSWNSGPMRLKITQLEAKLPYRRLRKFDSTLVLLLFRNI